MGEEIAFKNGRISDFQGLVTLTLDWVILHTAMYSTSSTSTYIRNFIEIEETLRTDGRTTFETHFVRSTRSGRPKNVSYSTAKSVGERILEVGLQLAKLHTKV